ncbi:glycosyltransferase [Loktanella sp. Alg231-35]|uniref:glycosyltransferase n=1 Tax=Loktanella sp. Alg231-35 TaxID=1922220 RepID=UPI001F19C38B|nr:glycosyltransferase [Loktanella sp. Alg231-35]
MDDDPFGLEHHSWVVPRSARTTKYEKLVFLGSKLRSIAKHRTARVPYGKTRDDICAFLHDAAPDAILAEFGNVALRIAPVANHFGIPVFTYFRGADASSQLRAPLRAAGYRRMMARLDGVFSVSQFLLDELASVGATHPNSHVVPSGVNTDLFVPSAKREGSFLAVGRLVEKKRPDITVKAFCMNAKDTQGITLDVVGDGPMQEQCQSIVRDFGMTDRVTFHGARPHDFVREMLGTSEVFLQHSVRAKNGNTEGLPTAIQEAMSCGLTIVSTRHAGIPEAVIEGENGHLVEEGDYDGFKAAIGTVSANLSRLPEFAERNRAKALACYDNRKLIKTVEREIEKVLKPK